MKCDLRRISQDLRQRAKRRMIFERFERREMMATAIFDTVGVYNTGINTIEQSSLAIAQSVGRDLPTALVAGDGAASANVVSQIIREGVKPIPSSKSATVQSVRDDFVRNGCETTYLGEEPNANGNLLEVLCTTDFKRDNQDVRLSSTKLTTYLGSSSKMSGNVEVDTVARNSWSFAVDANKQFLVLSANITSDLTIDGDFKGVANIGVLKNTAVSGSVNSNTSLVMSIKSPTGIGASR